MVASVIEGRICAARAAVEAGDPHFDRDRVVEESVAEFAAVGSGVVEESVAVAATAVAAGAAADAASPAPLAAG